LGKLENTLAMSETITCMIIEDQLPAQRVLQRYIGDLPMLKLQATCGDGLTAMQELKQHSVDLIFLDINLPKISGLNFLRSLANPPKVIITSAYPQYAVEGFELDVIDYLLKPFSFERFLKAISKVMTPDKPSVSLSNDEAKEEFTFVKSDKTIHRINFDEIIYIQSDNDFVHLVTTEKKYFLSQTLKYWNAILPKRAFVQIHKSYIVNLAKIENIRGNEVKTAQGAIPIGRSFKAQFLERIEEMM